LPWLDSQDYVSYTDMHISWLLREVLFQVVFFLVLERRLPPLYR
jgi:hypothetical protein